MKNQIESWLAKIDEEGEIPSNCAAIYIGLFEGKEDYQIYFVGSVDFDEEDEDWACIEDSEYVPENKYFASGVPTTTDWSDFEGDIISIIKD